jgi:hypothetical protein
MRQPKSRRTPGFFVLKISRKLAFREIFKTKNLPMQWADLGSIAIPESRDQRS